MSILPNKAELLFDWDSSKPTIISIQQLSYSIAMFPVQYLTAGLKNLHCFHIG